jgi:hypothetical protein
MASAERRFRDRRISYDRRAVASDLPSQRLDVSRLEHENLCRQIDELIRILQRIENGLSQQAHRIDKLDTDFRVLLRDRPVTPEKSL